ncbi:MAG: sugar ABC transporter permease [Spirochaetia bacterium]|nr:sugar ABC transporter permease [Spirochaetia bacterium]
MASKDDTRVAILFIVPALFFLTVFNYYPIIQTFIYSVFDLDLTTDWLNSEFIGMENYRRVMMSSQFWYTFSFTLGFTAVVVILDLSIGTALALSTFYVGPVMRGVLRAIIIIPWAIPKVIQASMWKWMLNSDVGPIGDMLVRLGIVQEPPLFLVDQFLAMGSIVLAYSWKGASMAAFFMMGGLALIPNDVIEAAKIDGAKALRRFFYIILPMVLPTLSVATLYRSRDALRVFDVVYGLTGGGPGTKTDTLSSFAYKTYFEYAQFGRGSAYAVVTFILVVIVGVFYIDRIKKNFSFKE